MISVCMATYNGERFIKEQIDSILVQLSEEDELIISDDGSTDSTLEIINSYKDERIRLYHHTKNPDFERIKYCRNFYYVASNFENALNRAGGDYIFLSDQDDIWYPNKVTKTLEVLQIYDICMSNLSVIDADNKEISHARYKKNPIKKSLFLNIIHSKYLGCCMAFTKEVLNHSLPFPKKTIGHDYWIGLCSTKFRFHFIQEPLIYYRRGEHNVSYFTNSRNPIWFRIFYRIRILMQLKMHKSYSTNTYKEEVLSVIS